MPLPLGHAAIGLTAHEVCRTDDSASSWWRVAVFVAVLSNLPDLDVVVGLFLQGNGWTFHKGPTHSLVFTLFVGLAASIAWRASSPIPRVSFRTCFLVILCHVLADSFLGASPVSFFWPFEANPATALEVSAAAGHVGWQGVADSVFLEPFEDAGIIAVCALAIILIRLIRRHPRIVRSVTKPFLPRS